MSENEVDEEGVYYYPVLRYYSLKNEKKKGIDYQEGPTEEDMIKFVQNVSGLDLVGDDFSLLTGSSEEKKIDL